MKEGKLLSLEQAVKLLYIIFILATIQEMGLKSELACNNCYHILLQFDLIVYTKNVKV
jgi:hypothetical protein